MDFDVASLYKTPLLMVNTKQNWCGRVNLFTVFTTHHTEIDETFFFVFTYIHN